MTRTGGTQFNQNHYPRNVDAWRQRGGTGRTKNLRRLLRFVRCQWYFFQHGEGGKNTDGDAYYLHSSFTSRAKAEKCAGAWAGEWCHGVRMEPNKWNFNSMPIEKTARGTGVPVSFFAHANAMGIKAPVSSFSAHVVHTRGTYW